MKCRHNNNLSYLNLNIIRNQECLVSYLDRPWDKSLCPWGCEEIMLGASCAACKVSNEITTKSFLYLRGLCESSIFDTTYQGNMSSVFASQNF